MANKTHSQKKNERENSEKLSQVEREFSSCGREDKAGSLKCSKSKKLSKMGKWETAASWLRKARHPAIQPPTSPPPPPNK